MIDRHSAVGGPGVRALDTINHTDTAADVVTPSGRPTVVGPTP